MTRRMDRGREGKGREGGDVGGGMEWQWRERGIRGFGRLN
jgi:hypothetical protein